MADENTNTEQAPKRNRTYVDGSVVGITLTDGTDINFDVSEAPGEIVKALALKAAKEELGASAREDGAEGVRQTIQRMKDGVWTDTRITRLDQAVARFYGVDEMAAAAKLAAMSQAERDTLAKHSKISAIMAEIALEKKKEKAASADDQDLPDLF